MKISFVSLLILTIFIFFKSADIVDTSQKTFFHKATYEKIHNFGQFQLGTWDNLIVQKESDALKLCQELRENRLLLKVLCEPGLNDFSTLVNSWLNDQFFNYKAPTKKEFESLSDRELSKLSVLMGPEGQKIFEFIRRDPVNHKEELLEKVKVQMNSNFEWKEGYLRHKSTSAILIPVQFNFRPEEIAKTAEIEKILSKYNAVMVGAYQGHLSNQGTIVEDLNNVGIVGTIVSIFALVLAVYFKFYRLTKLIVPNALGVCLSIIVTWLVFGNVHAITITFGTGIIGLALDFGLHAIFLEDKKKAWNSNLYGFLTTLAVFIIFIFSDIPLIKQMMFFSTVALMGSYLFTYLLVGDDYISLSYNVIIKKSRWHLVSLVLSLIGLFHLTTFKVDTSMKRFNFSSPQVEKIQNWFYSQMKEEKIFFKIYPQSEQKHIQIDFQNSRKEGIRSESIYSYLATEESQKENIASWIHLKKDFLQTTKDKIKIFSPFFDRLEGLKPEDRIQLSSPPEYIQHLVHNDKVLNLWFTYSKAEEERLTQKVSNTESFSDIFVGFTQNMMSEVLRFIPTSLILIIGLLYYKYKKIKKTLVCLIPFLFAVGLYGILYRYFHFPMSFMTLLGLFLIYGLSVDYGIFTTDLFTESNKSKKTESSFNIGLILTWLTNFLGFAPLLWCRHPILKDLGLVLVVGMIGVFYGTFFVIPAVFLNDEFQPEATK